MLASIRFASALTGCLLLPAAARAGEASAFDAVKDGVLTVYTIDDLTDGQPEIADQIGLLIRQTNSADGWTTKGGTAAAMRVTSERLTVKAVPATQRNIKTLLGVLREGRKLHIQVEYRVVDSATLKPRELTEAETGEKPAAQTPTPVSDKVRERARLAKEPGVVLPAENLFKVVDMAALPADAKTLLDASQVTVRNGDEAVWVDGVGLPLPTIRGQATVSADRKFATLSLTINTAAQGAVKVSVRVMQSLPLGRTGAVPLDERHTRWLLFTPTLVRTETKPA